MNSWQEAIDLIAEPEAAKALGVEHLNPKGRLAIRAALKALIDHCVIVPVDPLADTPSLINLMSERRERNGMGSNQ